jgi:hypothetical protein
MPSPSRAVAACTTPFVYAAAIVAAVEVQCYFSSGCEANVPYVQAVAVLYLAFLAVGFLLLGALAVPLARIRLTAPLLRRLVPLLTCGAVLGAIPSLWGCGFGSCSYAVLAEEVAKGSVAGVLAALFYWALMPKASNPAVEIDAYDSALRASSGAPHRER